MFRNQSEDLSAVKSLTAKLLFLIITTAVLISSASFNASADESETSVSSDVASSVADDSSSVISVDASSVVSVEPNASTGAVTANNANQTAALNAVSVKALPPVQQVPEVVSNFKAAAVNDVSIKLTWNKVKDAEGYIIYKYDNNRKCWVRITKTKNNGNTFTVTKLSAATNYKFAIKAYVTENSREVSSPKFPTVAAKTTNPAAVSNFRAAALNDSSVKLTWNKVSSAKGYIVYKYDNARKNWVRVTKTSGNVNTFTVNRLNPSTLYKFAIKAYVTIGGKEISSTRYPSVSATTKRKLIKIGKPVFAAEQKYDSGVTHPFNRQTNTLNLSWNRAANAKSYQVFVKGGKYKNWTHIKTVNSTNCTVTGLSRATTYYFIVRGVNGSTIGPNSPYITLKTARFNFDQAGWEAMCRIVYHEVGQTTDSMWDRPIVYVADCVSNRFTAAKYGSYYNNWAVAYRNYGSIQDVIYNSGGFMSSYGLASDGANYGNVSYRVKQAVYGATYAMTAYNGISNDFGVYFWCNRNYYQSNSNIAYSFNIPWGGYFNIWRTYWG